MKPGHFLLLSNGTGTLGGMALHARTPAGEALAAFSRHLASRQFAAVTQRIRRHFLDEFVEHIQQTAGLTRVTARELLDPARADAWLADAAAGKTRTRNTLNGPEAAASVDSMRVRVNSYNAFAEFLGGPDRRDSQPPADADRLTPAEAERVLHDLAVRRPTTPTPRPRCAPRPWPHWSPTPTGPS